VVMFGNGCLGGNALLIAIAVFGCDSDCYSYLNGPACLVETLSQAKGRLEGMVIFEESVTLRNSLWPAEEIN